MPFLCAYVSHEDHRPVTCSGIITYMRTASFDCESALQANVDRSACASSAAYDLEHSDVCMTVDGVCMRRTYCASPF